MERTDIQREILNKAIELLSPFNKENVSDLTYWFEDKEENDFGLTACNDPKCISEAIKDLRRNLPKHTRITTRYYANDGDHERFERCEICYRPLHRYLTWLNDEFEYFEKEAKPEQLTESHNAFELIGIFESVGWACDFGWQRDVKKQFEMQKALVARITDFAQKINIQLSNNISL